MGQWKLLALAEKTLALRLRAMALTDPKVHLKGISYLGQRVDYKTHNWLEADCACNYSVHRRRAGQIKVFRWFAWKLWLSDQELDSTGTSWRHRMPKNQFSHLYKQT